MEPDSDPFGPDMEGRGMRTRSGASIVTIAAFTLCATAFAAVDLPVPSEGEIAAISQKLVEGGCNSYALTPRDYSACIHRRARELPPLDPSRREHFGEQYDPARYLECMKTSYHNHQGCDRYELRRVDNPEYWPYPEVQGIHWPDPPKESAYRPGMSSKDYFEALCRAEAGEFIYRTVEGVEGIYQVRPRTRVSGIASRDRFVLEDPRGYISTGNGDIGAEYKFLQVGTRYQFLERPRLSHTDRATQESSLASAREVVRFRPTNELGAVVRELGSATTRYGYTWREVRRAHDSENGIRGGEIAVVDFATNEILGIRRFFARRDVVRGDLGSGYSWDADGCPRYGTEVTIDFVKRVLKPINAGGGNK